MQRGTILNAVAVLAFSTLAGCGIDESIHNAALKDLEDTKGRLTDAQKMLDDERSAAAADKKAKEARMEQLLKQNNALSKKLEEMGQDVSRLQTDVGSRDEELKKQLKAMEDLRRSQAKAEERAAQFRKLVTQFKALTDSGKLQVVIRENRMIVQLGDQILFDPGKTEIKKEGQDALKQVVVVLKDLKDRKFQVAGHTDNLPIKSKRFRSNWDLSTARAVEVVDFMIGNGMEPARGAPAGYADMSPVAPNDSPANQAKNRRIEITLVPNLDDLPPIDEALK